VFTQPITDRIQWQDFKVKNEVDVVFEIAQQQGWQDCEIFGHGDMITQPLDSTGWKLAPADLYEYSIPAEAVARVLQVINAGVRIQGIIIADDQRRTVTPPPPPRPEIALPSAGAVLAWVAKALLRLVMLLGVIVFVAGIVFMVLYAAVLLAPLLIVAAFLAPSGRSLDYDPKLIILVDGGEGETVWVSILTWYD
jgi:hypothetical protein